MNKISCDVVKDLLPLYKDEVCSEKSKELIENHLTECEDCRRYLDALNSELPPITLSENGIDGRSGDSSSMASDCIKLFQKIDRRLNWMKVIGILSVCIPLLVVSTILYVVKDYNKDLYLFDRRVAAEDVRITELYQLESGDIYVTLESEHPCTLAKEGTITSSDGTFDSESYDNGQSCLSFKKVSKLEHILFSRLDNKNYSFVIPSQEIIAPEDLDPDIYACVPEDYEAVESAHIVHTNTLIYYEGKYDERINIWERGQKLQQAPESIEKRVMAQRERFENGDVVLNNSKEASKDDGNILFIY